ncbi:hypothetical protein PHYBLDRAFT_153771 [Phycomyces blakesleeanus NRRL 1555(-)]|uniref:Uncharacterized protein n=1 Tax=Phycomyces blakesleeanus (strain ATCC 8743b / DSM 1359 / FGSC 10004 / NBRC 33097 / NRRL 1555) TaxID=763407 RepID=A0A162T916_PHYB8|nr:hypothetical protein PHYBLDRAFT_153771 [Phycomyces blakesleeanus NRRL 1555(-)]OAD65133.1 hypothetical protein PHYBLDRAFT_153771 [Phycomyces blakesleeanus NRRL 1555(-)]|eukprot:XP_018283173.1 hypothetical protein PHYBLDRAFT_153771 [Phycomyces blakesleeanus NRRL 1555(-)]
MRFFLFAEKFSSMTRHNKLPDKPAEQTDLLVLDITTWSKARPGYNTRDTV